MQTLFQNSKLDQSKGQFDLVIELSSPRHFLISYHSECYGLYMDENDLSSSLKQFEPLQISHSIALCWHENFTLIPKSLWDPENINQYVDRLFSKTKGNKFLYSDIRSVNAIALFAVDEDLRNELLISFPGISIQNPIQALIDYLIDVHESNDIFYVHKSGNLLVTILIRSNELIHCNVYPVNNIDEVIYFISYVCKEFDVDTHIKIGGDISVELMDLLSKYCLSVEKIYFGKHQITIVNQEKFNAILNPLVYADN